MTSSHSGICLSGRFGVCFFIQINHYDLCSVDKTWYRYIKITQLLLVLIKLAGSEKKVGLVFITFTQVIIKEPLCISVHIFLAEVAETENNLRMTVFIQITVSAVFLAWICYCSKIIVEILIYSKAVQFSSGGSYIHSEAFSKSLASCGQFQ